MEASGFVLAGGKSSRMGRDKALLAFGGKTLLEHVLDLVSHAIGRPAAIIGDPQRYAQLGFVVHPDAVSGCGPLGGIYTALTVSQTDWNLIAACDMPRLSAVGLRALLENAATSGAGCIAARSEDGEPEPLCAVYHHRSLPALERAIREKRFKMRTLLAELDTRTVALDSKLFANLNTPAEWSAFERHSE